MSDRKTENFAGAFANGRTAQDNRDVIVYRAIDLSAIAGPTSTTGTVIAVSGFRIAYLLDPIVEASSVLPMIGLKFGASDEWMVLPAGHELEVPRGFAEFRVRQIGSFPTGTVNLAVARDPGVKITVPSPSVYEARAVHGPWSHAVHLNTVTADTDYLETELTAEKRHQIRVSASARTPDPAITSANAFMVAVRKDSDDSLVLAEFMHAQHPNGADKTFEVYADVKMYVRFETESTVPGGDCALTISTRQLVD